jgi:TIR domain
MSNSEGAWIFLSHSTKDWDEVRQVRNLLEEKGHKPLVFFLKCLTEHSEVDVLIRREIEARNWFLLCDSENARQSSWVQAEVAYIKGKKEKHHEEIDLNASLESQIERIDRLCKRVTVFLSYARPDLPYARRIKEALVAHDYGVWLDIEAISPGTSWEQEITTAIERAVERGFVLVLLSPSSSQFMAREIEYALDKARRSAHGANIVPIMIHDSDATQAAMSPAVRSLLGGVQWFDFSRGDFHTNMARLIVDMKARAMD